MSVARDTALNKMISPNMTRPTTRGSILQIQISSLCDLSCVNCSQLSQLRRKPIVMDPDQFQTACESLFGFTGLVGLFGGNPATNKHFDVICDIFAAYFPREQRGLWCNNPLGHGKKMREVFDPANCNLNCHMQSAAYDEFARDWPETLNPRDPSHPFLKGMDVDSRHGPTLVSMLDLKELSNDEDARWKLIQNCEINRFWSAQVCVVNGEVKGFFCEIAAAMAQIHEGEDGWDLGVPAVPGWWDNGMYFFADQADFYCHRCSVPLKGHGGLAMSGVGEQVSATHADVYKPKDRQRLVELVTSTDQLGSRKDRATGYLPTEPRYAKD
jgi:hypothetical protein